MSRSPYHPPFHRRILPWLYLAVFLGLAPVVVFYTAGYRYNPKKNAVERNGTLILDSTPRDAQVSLDGRLIEETTPITLQNVAPGMHRIRLERVGFHAWEKELDVRPEQVTFANTIWLWRQAEPELFATGTIINLAENAERSAVAVLSLEGAAATLRILDEDGLTGGVSLKSSALTAASALRWREGGSELLLGGDTPGQPTWIAHTTPALRIEPLANGWYTWFEGSAVGSDGTAAIRLLPRRDTAERTPFAPGVMAQIGDLTLSIGSSSRELLLVDDRSPERALRLPVGAWVPSEERNGRWFFSDGSRWLALATADRQPLSSRAEGDVLRWNPEEDRALLLAANELNVWDGHSAPEPIWRQSDMLVDAIWHRSGRAIFLATEQTVYALELDNRGGRQATTLASFDEIRGLSILGRMLVVAGKRGEVEGVWGLRVE